MINMHMKNWKEFYFLEDKHSGKKYSNDVYTSIAIQVQ